MRGIDDLAIEVRRAMSPLHAGSKTLHKIAGRKQIVMEAETNGYKKYQQEILNLRTLIAYGN